MKAEVIKEMAKGNYKSITYRLGNYTVDACGHFGISRIDITPDEKKYLPKIYSDMNWDSEEWEFKIQTTAYGALKPEEINEVINGYQEAQEVVKELEKMFN